MSNLLTRAVDTHTRRLQRAAGEVVTYRRGSSNVKLTAVIGGSDFDEAEAEMSMTLQTRTVDFLFEASALRLGGKLIDPERGDQIERANGEVFDVQPGTDTTPANWNDGRAQLYRVHAMRRSNVES